MSIKNFLHTMDARCKIAGLIAFIFLCSSLRNINLLICGALLILLVMISSRELINVLKRFAVTLPFGAALAILIPFTTPGRVIYGSIFGINWLNITHEGMNTFYIVILKFTISILTVLLMSATTPISKLISALRGFKVPSIFIVLLEFILRYFTLFKDEIDRMMTARKCRGFNDKSAVKSIKEISKIIGWAFIRAYNRSLRIYNSMISRGFDGEFRYSNLKRPMVFDYIFAAGFIIFGTSLILLDRSGFVWNMPLK